MISPHNASFTGSGHICIQTWLFLHFVQTYYAGSWNTFTENITSCDAPVGELPTSIYVMEPSDTCPLGHRIWPQWYSIALAITGTPPLNITGKLVAKDVSSPVCHALCERLVFKFQLLVAVNNTH